MPYHTVREAYALLISLSSLYIVKSQIIHPGGGGLPALASTGDCMPIAQEDYSGSCVCTSIRDIRCLGLKVVPRLVASSNRSYGGLYMSAQKITSVPDGIFSGIQVHKIVLNFNTLGNNLSGSAFRGLESVLQELHLGDCGLTTLPQNLLAGLTQLKYLYLWGNQISSIPNSFFISAGNLLELSLWGNRLERLDEDTFSGLGRLRKLDLDRNRISNLKRDAFRHHPQLEILHMGENNIDSLPSEAFSRMHNLRVLSLDGNRIDSDGLMPRIISGNRRGRLAFHGLGNLQSLALNDNRLSTIPAETFSPLYNLSSLSLQNNRLQTIWPTTFGGLASLLRLDLSNNSLDDIPSAALKSSTRLRHLYLDHNNIRRLKCFLPHSMTGWDVEHSGREEVTLKTLSMLGNEIQCDCRLTWIVSLHEKGKTDVWGTCTQSRTLISPSSVINKASYHGLSCTFQSGQCSQ